MWASLNLSSLFTFLQFLLNSPQTFRTAITYQRLCVQLSCYVSYILTRFIVGIFHLQIIYLEKICLF